MGVQDTLVIGFGHKSRNGKDTAAQTIIEERGHKYDIRRYAFADALKREVDELGPFELCLKHGIRYDQNPAMDDPFCTTQHGKQRDLLQFWGNYRRDENPFYWVRKINQRLNEEKPKIALVTDVRYLNETHWVKETWKGFTVDVQRLGFQALDPRQAMHISETALDDYTFDYAIQVLDGDLDELKKDALFVFDHICESLFPEDAAELEGEFKKYVIRNVVGKDDA